MWLVPGVCGEHSGGTAGTPGDAAIMGVSQGDGEYLQQVVSWSISKTSATCCCVRTPSLNAGERRPVARDVSLEYLVARNMSLGYPVSSDMFLVWLVAGDMSLGYLVPKNMSFW